MIDPSLELQDAIVRTLKGGAAVVGGRVYDAVSPTATYPYISLGDSQVLPEKANCVDGVEVFPQIDVWSRSTGYGEVKSIVKDVLSKLDDQPLTISGFDVVVFEVQSVNYLRDPDGLTRHAAITFHGLVVPH